MNSNDEYQPWRLEWTPKHIERFWNWWGSNPALTKHYFAKRNGDALLSQVGRYVQFSGTIVDLGAGPGYIVDLLLGRGVSTLAIDTSAESLAVLERRVSSNEKFLGTRTSQIDKIPLDDEQAQGVLLVETIEHLGDEALQSLLREAHRIIRQGGWIAISTPNDERLEELETICPNCGCVYHYYQHMRSWSASSLEQQMRAVGFTTLVCRPTLFSHLPTIARPFHRLAYPLFGYKLPHLLYVGIKALKVNQPR